MRSISVSSFFFCPPSYYFKGFCCLSYIIWSTWLVSAVKQDLMSWQGKDHCGKSVCVEWNFSDLEGQIPHDCPIQRERVSVSPQSHALPRQTCMS